MSIAPRSETRRALVLFAWRARCRARLADTARERGREWGDYYYFRRRARALLRRLPEAEGRP